MKMRIKKKDLVKIISGDERLAGKPGTVMRVIPETRRVIVEGVNFVKKHTKARSQTQPGGIIEMEAPLHVSNVKLICPKCKEPTRVGVKIMENRSKMRVCKKCNEVID